MTMVKTRSESLVGKRRPYKSKKRLARVVIAKQRILKAMVDQLSDQSSGGFSIPKVARKANVSVRTIYRHFQNRRNLLEAFRRQMDSLQSIRNEKVPFPRSINELVQIPFDLYDFFDENALLIRAQFYSPIGRELRAFEMPKRREAYRFALREVTSTLSQRQAKQVDALFHLIIGQLSWLHFRDTWGLTAKEAAEISSWAARALLSELMRPRFDRQPSVKELVDNAST